MNRSNTYLDEYDEYEEQFNRSRHDHRARRQRKQAAAHTPKKSSRELVAEMAEITGLDEDFNTSYQLSRHEEGWLLASLHPFYSQGLITDVVAKIKGGKEASVYRCVAHPATGATWLAAKVYRPRMFRNLRNDKMYRQGRPTLAENGRPVKATDTRLMRALGKKSDFGVHVEHTSWLMYEYTTLERLYQAGAAVPRPIAAGQNAILMTYYGDEQMAAPTLNEVALEPDEAGPLFREVMRNVELMLRDGRIHGDLSAYNILYWDGQAILIDFPQVVNSRVSNSTHAYGNQVNPDAYHILARDITRVCEYFAEQGVNCDPGFIMRQLWQRYAAARPQDRAADASRLEVTEAR